MLITTRQLPVTDPLFAKHFYSTTTLYNELVEKHRVPLVTLCPPQGDRKYYDVCYNSQRGRLSNNVPRIWNDAEVKYREYMYRS